ncbi:large-conductance mechanosensitive channel [Chytriomyces sp. MP71]|nr:large-conductance mechanosensitive channel [Chytriomyces sp. MP71]
MSADNHQTRINVKDAGSKVANAGKTFIDDFKKFLERGSLVDLAVGIVIGAAFTAVVNSLVNDLITPIIGLATGASFENNFLVIRCSDRSKYCTTGGSGSYTTVALANADGAVTWNYGRFIQTVIQFLIVGLVVFLLVKTYTRYILRPKAEPVATRKCEECLEAINIDAKKCKFCGSSQ